MAEKELVSASEYRHRNMVMDPVGHESNLTAQVAHVNAFAQGYTETVLATGARPTFPGRRCFVP